MFKGETILKRIDHNIYELLSTLEYENDSFRVQVNNGFHTDGASIPRFLWTIIGCPMSGKYVGSAIIHDALYASQILSRESADELFLEMLKHNGVHFIKRTLMFYAVRVFGGVNWGRVEQEAVINSRKIVKVTIK